jgi:hypothetical protein
VRKELALRTEKFVGRTGNEEHWHASRLRFEVKAGKQVEPIAVRYLRARQQSDAAKSIGDTRPFVMAAVPDGSQTLLVIRADEIRAVVDAFCEEWA